MTPDRLSFDARARLCSQDDEQHDQRSNETEEADGRRRSQPAEPSEPPLVVWREETHDEEVRREACEKDAREVPVADESREGQRRAALTSWRVPERARELVREGRDRGDARHRERDERREDDPAEDEREHLAAVRRGERAKEPQGGAEQQT